MKKTVFFILLFVACMTFQLKGLKATSTLPVGKNYLSLSNLLLSSDNSYFASTIAPIKVIPNLPYTIVLSYEFLGQHAGYIDYYPINIIELPSHYEYALSFQADNIQERAYIEFMPSTDLIHLVDIPMIPLNYNAIMYQGTYLEFNGYEPYLHHTEVLDYYGVIPVDYDDLLSLEELQQMVFAKDPYHQEVLITVILDEYSSSDQLPGSYQIIFQALYNQVAKRFHLDVRVYDITRPILINTEEFMIPLTEKIDTEEIINYVQISDNVDVLTHQDLIIIEDTYSNASTVGLYHLLLEARDLSGNRQTIRIDIELIDRLAPTISGPPQVYVYTTDIPLTTAYIQSLFYIIDDVDGINVEIDWVLNDYMQNQLPGIYLMTIRAKDSQLNISTKNIEVHVIENRGPIFENNEVILEISVHNQMTHEQIIDWFIEKAVELGLNTTHVRILYNEYALGNQEEGSYYVYLSYRLDGVETTSRVVINVVDKEQQSSLIFYAIGTALLVASSTVFIIKKKKS
jgi:hypothetical protein